MGFSISCLFVQSVYYFVWEFSNYNVRVYGKYIQNNLRWKTTGLRKHVAFYLLVILLTLFFPFLFLFLPCVCHLSLCCGMSMLSKTKTISKKKSKRQIYSEEPWEQLARMLSKQQRLEQRLEDFSRASSKRDISNGHFKQTF